MKEKLMGFVKTYWKKALMGAALIGAGYFGGAPAREALSALLRALGVM